MLVFNLSPASALEKLAVTAASQAATIPFEDGPVLFTKSLRVTFDQNGQGIVEDSIEQTGIFKEWRTAQGEGFEHSVFLAGSSQGEMEFDHWHSYPAGSSISTNNNLLGFWAPADWDRPPAFEPAELPDSGDAMADFIVDAVRAYVTEDSYGPGEADPEDVSDEQILTGVIPVLLEDGQTTSQQRSELFEVLAGLEGIQAEENY